MLRFALSAPILLLMGGGVRAGDFSGFYAGLNAGYAAGRQGDRPGTVPSAGGRAALGPDRAEGALPPSAVDAAGTMKAANRTGARTSGLR